MSEPGSRPTLEALPGRASDLGGLAIRRLLPRSRRRLVGPWCFLDSFGPLAFVSGKPMDVAPHPHFGLQAVSWLLDGEVLHNDSLGRRGLAAPGVLNLMTAGRGIAHSEETPPGTVGRLWGVQLWLALPEASRETLPWFEQHRDLPVVKLDGGRATVILGELAGPCSPGLRTAGAAARVRAEARARAAPGRGAVRRDRPDVVELRRADDGGDRRGPCRAREERRDQRRGGAASIASTTWPVEPAGW